MMMNYAYDELYLPLAQRTLGDMFDYAVNVLGYSLESFYSMFVASNMSYQFEIGNPTYVAGKNGCEIAREVLEQSGIEISGCEDVMQVDKSCEYWIGWVVAYYQWNTNLKYKDIENSIDIGEMYNMYPTFHEADISVFVDAINERRMAKSEISRLKRFRMYAGLSQSMLSKKSGVPLRQIQLFEQRQRDINKAQCQTVYNLASTLKCEVKDILEPKLETNNN